MANEFKIKKGLIVTGASGGTVVDIQGSQGQLFSVTDDLSGSIFAVSDISGVPILDVNSSGNVGINTTSPADLLHIKSASWAARIQSSADNSYLRMSPNQIAAFTSAGAGSALYINNSSSGNILMAGGGGNVGIGTTNPLANLDVRDSAGGTVRIGTDTNNIGQDTAFGTLEFYNGDTSNSGPGVTAMIQAKTYNQYSTGGDITFSNKIYPSDTIAERMRISSAGAIKFNSYNSTNQTGTPTYLLGTDATGNVVKTLASGGGAAPQTSFDRSGINSSTYTMLFTASGGGYGSLINMTISGTSGNVVVSASFEIIVNHSQDIHVRSMSGDYTKVTLRITSDNNASYSVEAKHNGATTTTVAVCVQPQNNDTITPTTTDPGYTGAEYEHTATEGWRFGGEDNNVESSNVIIDGVVGIGTTSPGAKLSVGAYTYAGGMIGLKQTAADAYGIVMEASGNDRWVRAGHNGTYGIIETTYAATGGNSDLYIKTSTSNNVVLQPVGGNVGIGVTGPGEKLEVDGIIKNNSFINTGGQAGAMLIGRGSAMSTSYLANDFLMFNTGGDCLILGTGGAGMTVKATTGNVGIGTTAPGAKLDVDGSVRLGGTNAQNYPIKMGRDNHAVYLGGPNINTINVAWDINTEYNMHINYVGYQGGTTQFRDLVINNGKTGVIATFDGSSSSVGIGTTAPSAKLDIVGDGTNFALEVNNTSTGDAIKINTANATGNNGIYWNQGAVNLFNLFSTTSNDTRLRLGNAAGTKIHLSTNAASYFTGGGVGIATTSPGTAYSLVVATIVGQTGSIEGQGSMKVTSGALGVNVTPSGTAGRIDASNDIVAYSSSDERLKENITPITDATEKVKKLTGIEFDWKEEFKDAHGHEGRDTGVIAQQVLEVMPTAVRENDTGYLAVRYEKLIGLLIESNKELAARIERLEGLVELMLK